MQNEINNVIADLAALPSNFVVGYVTTVRGLLIEAKGLAKYSSIGSRCRIKTRTDQFVLADVIGVNNGTVLLMPFDQTIGIGVGCEVVLIASVQSVYPNLLWLGRVINAFAKLIDGKGPLPNGVTPYKFYGTPPPPNLRQRVGKKLNMGIRAINTFLSCCRGQRMGIFAGSGVGKSMMLAMITKYSDADIKIIGLIGERGREVQEFLEDYLGPEGLSKAIVVVATSDESALTRRQATYLTMTLAEYFRDLGMDVLCMIDSITRFATAQREIGLASGEPPTTRGYTPSVFSELPKVLERAGPGTMAQGMITGLFSVLVEGDDQNEPIADAVRGILDGHIVLDRKIAGRGVYPAIDVMRSISRTMPQCNTDAENDMIKAAKTLLATYDDMEDMIRIGAYKKGSDSNVDIAVQYHDRLDAFISQKPHEYEDLDSSYAKLATAIDYSKKSP